MAGARGPSRLASAIQFRTHPVSHCASPHSTVWLDLGFTKTPMPRFICVAEGVPFRVGQCKTELFRVQRKPPERFCMRKRPIQRQATQCGDIDGTSGVMFAESRRRAHQQNSVDTQPTFEFFANDFGLPVTTTERRSNLQIYVV